MRIAWPRIALGIEVDTPADTELMYRPLREVETFIYSGYST